MEPARRCGGWVSRIVASTILAVTMLVAVPPAGAVDERPESDFVTFDSAPGHYPGLGESRTWSGAQLVELDHFLDGGFELTMQSGSDPTDTWTIRVAPPRGDTLRPGIYEQAFGHSVGSVYPHFDLFGDGRGCASQSSFRVLDFSPDLSRIWIVFEHRCGFDLPERAAWGQIKIGIPSSSGSTTFLTDPVRWREWYPGHETPADTVAFFNTGPSPVTVHGARVVAGSADFRLTEHTCGALPVRGSCRLFVAFRPVAAGERHGTLRLFTSSGVRDVELSGHGIPGYNRGRVRIAPTSSDPDGAWRTFAMPDWVPYAEASSSSGTLPVHDLRLGYYSPDADSHWEVELKAPDGFAEGATYSTPAVTEPGSLTLDDENGVCRGPGRFTIHELELDVFEVERALVTFRIHCSGWITGTLAWRSDAPPPPPPAPPEAGPLSLDTDRTEYAYGAQATVTARLPEARGQQVAVYATPAGGQPVELGTEQVDEHGLVRMSMPVTRNTTFTAVSGDQEAERSVEVSALVAALARRQVGSRGKYLLFRARRGARILGGVAPAHTDDCLYLHLQRRRNGGWRTTTARCLRTDERGLVRAVVRGARGTAKRLRFVFPGDEENTAAASPWIYARYVRR